MAPQLITELYAFIATEKEGEGVAAVRLGDTMFPLFGADQARVDSLRTLAQDVANRTGMTLTLARFQLREDLDTITPAGQVA